MVERLNVKAWKEWLVLMRDSRRVRACLGGGGVLIGEGLNKRRRGERGEGRGEKGEEKLKNEGREKPVSGGYACAR